MCSFFVIRCNYTHNTQHHQLIKVTQIVGVSSVPQLSLSTSSRPRSLPHSHFLLCEQFHHHPPTRHPQLQPTTFTMEIWRSVTVGAFLVFGFICFYGVVDSCNEVVCASIVSKCMLTQSCKCELKNCSCCKECLKCLGKRYYEECCSCVGMY